MTGRNWVWRLMVVATVIGMSTATAAWGGASASGRANAGGTSSISIADEYGVAWNCEFNPYSGSDEFGSFGPVYEELVFMNSLKDGATTPWLATAWSWSNHNTTLT